MKMKASTVKTRMHSLFNQGLFYFDWLLTMREESAKTLVQKFDELVRQHARIVVPMVRQTAKPLVS